MCLVRHSKFPSHSEDASSGHTRNCTCAIPTSDHFVVNLVLMVQIALLERLFMLETRNVPIKNKLNLGAYLDNGAAGGHSNKEFIRPFTPSRF